MLLPWVKAKLIAEFANSLADEIIQKYSPDKFLAGKQPSLARVTRVLEAALEKAAQFHARYSLGWVGKAKLANTVRWRLQEVGYPADFIQVVIEGLLVYLSKQKPS